jgi:hypothetical protein
MCYVYFIKLAQSLADLSRPLEASTLMALKLRPGFSITVPGVRIIDVSKPEWLEYIQKSQSFLQGYPGNFE